MCRHISGRASCLRAIGASRRHQRGPLGRISPVRCQDRGRAWPGHPNLGGRTSEGRLPVPGTPSAQLGRAAALRPGMRVDDDRRGSPRPRALRVHRRRRPRDAGDLRRAHRPLVDGYQGPASGSRRARRSAKWITAICRCNPSARQHSGCGATSGWAFGSALGWRLPGSCSSCRGRRPIGEWDSRRIGWNLG